MREIRGPDFPIPNSVPDELVERYGAEARSAVRSRRSWRFRQTARFRSWRATHDLWEVVIMSILWAIILAGVGGTIAVSAIHWPRQTVDAGVLAGVAVVSSLITIVVLAHRFPERRRAGRT